MKEIIIVVNNESLSYMNHNVVKSKCLVTLIIRLDPYCFLLAIVSLTSISIYMSNMEQLDITDTTDATDDAGAEVAVVQQ